MACTLPPLRAARATRATVAARAVASRAAAARAARAFAARAAAAAGAVGARAVVLFESRCGQHVNQLGGIVFFSPPYRFDTTPLENGAFGLVKRYLQEHSEILLQQPLERVLDYAFESVTRGSAFLF